MKKRYFKPLGSPAPPYQDYSREQGSLVPVWRVLMICCLLLLRLPSFGQHIEKLTLEQVELLQANCTCQEDLKTQIIPYEKSYLIRFNELGRVYNPTYPKTRNRVYVTHFWKEADQLTLFSKSISTNRATVKLKGRVGEFYGLMVGRAGNSMLHYFTEKKGNDLRITGQLLTDCRRPN